MSEKGGCGTSEKNECCGQFEKGKGYKPSEKVEVVGQVKTSCGPSEKLDQVRKNVVDQVKKWAQ